jgi:hypothetical protein
MPTSLDLSQDTGNVVKLETNDIDVLVEFGRLDELYIFADPGLDASLVSLCRSIWWYA